MHSEFRVSVASRERKFGLRQKPSAKFWSKPIMPIVARCEDKADYSV